MQIRLESQLNKKVRQEEMRLKTAENLEIKAIKRMSDVGILKYYEIKNIEGDFHSNFMDLNPDYNNQRRFRAHTLAERYINKLK